MSDIRLGQRLAGLFDTIAYPIALWNIFILFFEPVVGHYVNIGLALFWTALVNITFLLITINLRLISKPFHEHRQRTWSDIILLLLGSSLLLFDSKFVIFFLLIRQTFYIVRYFLFHAFNGVLFQRLLKNPPVTFLLSFASVILFGSILLMLPSATATKNITPFITAIFTATSATCVTGLTVVNTSTYFTLFGQLVILFLIQIGGLGIMTISTAFAILLGQKLNLSIANIMRDVTGENLHFDMFALLKQVMVVTVSIEAIGIVFLYGTFIQYYEPTKAFYYALFHSVSAFCNAGFGLYSDSFIRYAFNLNINLVITLLIIFGGIGFPVIMDVFRYIFKTSNRLSLTLNTKLVLSTTCVLLIMGTVLFFISEYYQTMKDMTIPHKIMCSWFQSVTCRTAGFNTIDESQISHASSLISIILMFIGASPGSTGGGVKTSTFALLILTVYTMMRGQPELTVYKRKISLTSIRDSSSLITLAMGFIGLIVFLILLNDPFGLEKTLFEAVSAFGTVGLSRGITPYLSDFSKTLIIILMYIGRVGPLTLLYAVAQRRKAVTYSYAEEKVSF